MDEYTRKNDVIKTIKRLSIDPKWTIWNDLKEAACEHIKQLQPADVRPASEISEAVDEALRVLDSINTSGRLDYSDYCEMHDAICSISSDKGKD